MRDIDRMESDIDGVDQGTDQSRVVVFGGKDCDPANPDYRFDGKPRASGFETGSKFIRAAGSYALVASALCACNEVLPKLPANHGGFDEFLRITRNLEKIELRLKEMLQGG